MSCGAALAARSAYTRAPLKSLRRRAMSAARAVRVTSMLTPHASEPCPPDEEEDAAAWPFLPDLDCGAGVACAPPLGLISNVCAAAGTAINTREQNRTWTIFFTGPPERQFRC